MEKQFFHQVSGDSPFFFERITEDFLFWDDVRRNLNMALLQWFKDNRKKEHKHVFRIDFEFMHGENQEKDCFNTQLQVNKRLDIDEFQDGFARAACARIVRNAQKRIKPDELNAFIVTFTRV